MSCAIQIRILTLLVLVLSLPQHGFAQRSAHTEKDSALITATVTVRNQKGEYVIGLKRDTFVVTDGREKPSIEFFDASDTPVSIGILIDASGSVQLSQVRELALARPLVN